MRKTAARAALLFLLAGLTACGGGGSAVPGPQVSTVTSADESQRSVASAMSTSTLSAARQPDSSGAEALPWVYAELWSGSSPFRTTVSALKSSGAWAVAHTYMDSLWSQGLASNTTSGGIPVYVAKPSDPLLTTICTMYGGRCNASGVKIHVPSYARPQQQTDAHITVVDEYAPSGPIEIDCWQASHSGSTFRCSWAGKYMLGASGVDAGGSGIHGGMAVTTIFTAGQELSNGYIGHALGLDTRCLNSPNLFPADTTVGTDRSCNGSSSPPHYGNLVHLVWSSSQIASSGYSAPCRTILTALATYGAYLDDTGDDGLQIHVVDELSYTADPATAGSDPWPGIQSRLNAGGDGFGNRWYSCLQRLRSSDFELLEVRG